MDLWVARHRWSHGMPVGALQADGPINNQGEKAGLFKDVKENLSGDDVREGLTAVAFWTILRIMAGFLSQFSPRLRTISLWLALLFPPEPALCANLMH